MTVPCNYIFWIDQTNKLYKIPTHSCGNFGRAKGNLLPELALSFENDCKLSVTNEMNFTLEQYRRGQ